MSFEAYAINSVWMWRCRPEWRRFLQATKRVAVTQELVLRKIVQGNSQTEFGTRFGFRQLTETKGYQRSLPLMDEREFESAIERIADGQTGVLTREPVELLQPTSGTIRGEKLIPYTASLRSEYQRMISAWVGNLYADYPPVRFGKAFWSISPPVPSRVAHRVRIRVGFDDDTAYLGKLEQRIAQRVLAVPSAVAQQTDLEKFRYWTLLHLLRSRDLSLISIWSPTFLSALLDLLPQHIENLLRDLHNGTVVPSSCEGQRCPPVPPDRRRADELSRAWDGQHSTTDLCRQLWPQLALISCWMDGPSRLFAQRLQAQCAGIPFQAKGLLATEACVSFPVVGQDGCALAIRSHFFEFLPVDPADDRALLAHELSIGQRYTVVVTTGGGLYRYPLHDIIEVTGKLDACPLVRFVGRSQQTSDMVGEKLHESFVQECVGRALAKYQVLCSFAAFSPELVEIRAGFAQCRYRLQVEVSSGTLPADRIASTLDEYLRDNIHYRYARDLQQLGPIEVDILPGPPGSAWSSYEKLQLNCGRPLGALKPQILIANSYRL